MPYPELVLQVREALQSIYDAGLCLENTWSEERRKNPPTSIHESEEPIVARSNVDPRGFYESPSEEVPSSMITGHSVNDVGTVNEALWESSQAASQVRKNGSEGDHAVQPPPQSLNSVVEEGSGWEPPKVLSPRVVRRLKGSLSWMELLAKSKRELMKELGEEEQVCSF
jgi:hypothetical protein